MTGFLLLMAALSAAGPGGTVAGRVVRVVGSDTLSAVGAVVVLHRVTADEQGPIDSLRAGPDGAFRFAVTADSGTLLLISARWQGIDYFATPVRAGSPGATPLIVLVSDTSATVTIRLAARHLVIGAPAADGTRNVVDLLLLENAEQQTRVAAGRDQPTWQLALPPSAVNVVVGESDFASDAVDVHGDSLELHAAIPPGQRQILLHYQIPPSTRRLQVPFSTTVALVNLLLEEGDTEVRGTVQVADSAVTDGVEYRRWTGNVAAGDALELRFTRLLLPTWLTPLLAALFALGLAFLAVRTNRRRVPAKPTLTVLLDALAQLDAANAGQESVRSAAEWQQYLAARHALKEEIRSLLPS